MALVIRESFQNCWFILVERSQQWPGRFFHMPSRPEFQCGIDSPQVYLGVSSDPATYEVTEEVQIVKRRQMRGNPVREGLAEYRLQLIPAGSGHAVHPRDTALVT